MTSLKTPSSRARLPRERYHFDAIAPGVALAYRRGPKAGRDGVWAVRFPATPGSTSRYQLVNIGLADDETKADGDRWLTYREAAELALTKARNEEKIADRPMTVGEACRAYIERRRQRGTGRVGEAETTLRKYLGPLADERVAGLSHDALQAWAHKTPHHATALLRAALNKAPVKVRPSSVTTSALNEHRAIQRRGLVDAVMSDAEVSATVAKARRHDPAFGLLVAVLASTGCRPSQVTRCRVGDLLPREAVLIVPPSAKGKPGKPKPTQRLPLDPALCRELQKLAGRRPNGALLFTLPRMVRGDGLGWKADGERAWRKDDWGRAAIAAGVGRRLYDCRHAAIVRMLLAGVPIRLIAAKLDTSVKQIESTYSRWIGDAGDDLMRAALAPRLAVVS